MCIIKDPANSVKEAPSEPIYCNCSQFGKCNFPKLPIACSICDFHGSTLAAWEITAVGKTTIQFFVCEACYNHHTGLQTSPRVTRVRVNQ